MSCLGQVQKVRELTTTPIIVGGDGRLFVNSQQRRLAALLTMKLGPDVLLTIDMGEKSRH